MILKYDIKKYPFIDIFKQMIGEEELDLLYNQNSTDSEQENSIYKETEQTHYYKRLQENLKGDLGSQFYELYHTFIEKEIKPFYQEPVFYQIKPTCRILFRNTLGESRFHRDTDYGHFKEEINYTVAITDAYDSNAIWLEKEPNKQKPIELKVGEYASFDGANLLHGAKVNKTDRSRVSFDFRVVPLSQASQKFIDQLNRSESEQLADPHNFSLCK